MTNTKYLGVPGQTAVHVDSGETAILHRRKDNDSGWWVDSNQMLGIADFVLEAEDPNWILLPLPDWTCRDSVSNSSDKYNDMVEAVQNLIRGGSGSILDKAWVYGTARLIVSQLAHVHGLAPKDDGTQGDKVKVMGTDPVTELERGRWK